MDAKHELRRPVILIADDNALMRKSLCECVRLDVPDAFILEAENGREAVKTAMKECPHIVLMDINMPQMNGIEATMKIKLALPSTRIIIVSTHDDNMFRIVAKKAGASAYILKSEVVDELPPILREILYENVGAGTE